MGTAKVTGCFYYPVKSCAGISVDSLELVSRGPKWDRNWMFVDANYKFISMRKHHKLCLVQPHISADGLQLTAPGMEKISLPVQDDSGREVLAQIWDDQVIVEEVKAAREWISDYLKQDIHMVKMGQRYSRPVSQKYIGPNDKKLFDQENTLSDGFPLLITNEESLKIFNSHLEESLPMANFRPNIIVSGAESFSENHWNEIKLGDIFFKVSKPCTRCVMICVNQQEGSIPSMTPLKLLKKINAINGRPIFGQNIIQRQLGRVCVGDVVSIKKDLNYWQL